MARARILVAPNAFKGCLSAARAADAMARGARRAAPGAVIDRMPISDGGDGLMEVLLAHLGGRRVSLTVTGPLGRPRRAAYALLAGRREAVIEMAQASGLARLPPGELDALGATSFGTGELVADALRRGARRVLVGMGGAASNDGGAGAAQALGARLLDRAGRDLPFGAAALERLDRVDASGIEPLLRGAEILAVSDVRNPLLGRFGSARVYGPQKGATPAMVRRLEKALGRYARVLKRDLGRDVAGLPGAGAAGGLGAGLAAFLGAELVPGAELVLERLGARKRVASASLVLTGEGRLDFQSFFGKAPVTLARLAKTRGRPVRFLCGQVSKDAAEGLRAFGKGAAYPLSAGGPDAARALKECSLRLRAAAAKAVADALKAGLLALILAAPARAAPRAPEVSTAPVAASSSDFAEEDRLYFHRHRPGNLEKAIELLKARAAAEEEAAVLWRLARALVRMGERPKDRAKRLEYFKEAERLSQRAVELAPKDAQAHFSLGLSYGRRGETQGMMSSLFLVKPIRREMETAIALDPSHAGAHHVLGEMLRRLPRVAGGSKKEALRHLEEAVRLRPDRTAAYTDLAQAYLDLGRKEEAKKVLERLLTIQENDDPAELEDHKADAREMLGRL